MNKTEYITKIDNKGRITMPDKLLKELGWHVGTQLTIKVNKKHEIIIAKANLYDTNFGNYDFQKELHNNPELCEVKEIGKEKAFNIVDNLEK